MKKISALLFALALMAGPSHMPRAFAVETNATTAAADSGTSPTVEKLAKEIDKVFEDPRFRNAFWGALIKSQKDGTIWYSRNANKVFMPASNQKIVTTAPVLLALGPDETFKTILAADGKIEGKELKGNLVVWSDGDPTISTFWEKDPRDVFRAWAKELKAKGIEKIDGDIIGDDNAFDDETIGDGWALNNLPSSYSAEIGPLQLAENTIDFKIQPPKTEGEPVLIIPALPSTYFTVDNKIKVEPKGSQSVEMTRGPFTNKFDANGRVSVGGAALEDAVSITNPTLFYVTVLKETLVEEGIAVTGKPVDVDDLPAYDKKIESLAVLVERRSKPLREIARMLMKRSQNLFAETFPRFLAYKRTGKGSFSAGRRIIQEQLRTLDVAPKEYIYTDGSGLTRYNYVSPEALVKILEGMDRSPYKDVWRETMPIAGVDGTLRGRMKGTKAQGNVRAKTGTISNVRGLSGYVTTADGEPIVFSFLVNNHTTSTAATNEVTDGVLEKIASFDRGAGSQAPESNASAK